VLFSVPPVRSAFGNEKRENEQELHTFRNDDNIESFRNVDKLRIGSLGEGRSEESKRPVDLT